MVTTGVITIQAIVRAASQLDCRSAIIDGEAVIQDFNGASDFDALALAHSLSVLAPLMGRSESFGEIFEAFTRLDHAGQYEGTGLGLATCKKIVERPSGADLVQGEEHGRALDCLGLSVCE
jgi:hypothetical protein